MTSLRCHDEEWRLLRKDGSARGRLRRAPGEKVRRPGGDPAAATTDVSLVRSRRATDPATPRGRHAGSRPASARSPGAPSRRRPGGRRRRSSAASISPASFFPITHQRSRRSESLVDVLQHRHVVALGLRIVLGRVETATASRRTYSRGRVIQINPCTSIMSRGRRSPIASFRNALNVRSLSYVRQFKSGR
jgi:hypothetical protein